MAQRLEEYSTYIWQVQPRKNTIGFKPMTIGFQGSLRKRPNAKLYMYGVNAPFWIFEAFL